MERSVTADGSTEELRRLAYETKFSSIVVPEKLNNPHWLTKRFASGGYNYSPGKHTDIHNYKPPYSETAQRAFRILDASLKTLQQLGYELMEEDVWWVRATNGDHNVRFRVKERFRNGQRQNKHGYSDSALLPTGMVHFSTIEREWLDKPSKPIEAQLPTIFSWLMVYRDRDQQRSIENRSREEEIFREHQLNLAREREARNESASWTAFTSMANAWEAKSKLQSFYFALRSLPADGSTMVGERSIDEWKVWLEQQIADSDPLKDGAEEVFRRLERARLEMG